jgi:hypothetical protein
MWPMSGCYVLCEDDISLQCDYNKRFANRKKRMEKKIVLREESRNIRKKLVCCIVMQSDTLMDGDEHIVIYAPNPLLKITFEGPSGGYIVVQQTTEESEVIKAFPNYDIELHPPDAIKKVLSTCLDDKDVALLP